MLGDIILLDNIMQRMAQMWAEDDELRDIEGFNEAMKQFIKKNPDKQDDNESERKSDDEC